MINLNETEVKIINFSKGRLKGYKSKNSFIEDFKPLFKEIFLWNPDEDNNYIDYLNCTFKVLLDLQLKINDDKSGSNKQLHELFEIVFFNKIGYEHCNLPIERAISKLFSLIRNNQVTENGIERYKI